MTEDEVVGDHSMFYILERGKVRIEGHCILCFAYLARKPSLILAYQLH